MLNITKFKDFLPYFILGGLATLMDWSIFWFTSNELHFNYGTALICAYGIASIFHFFSNKWITFKCEAKQLVSQYSIYTFVSLMSLLFSLLCMTFFVKILIIHQMNARIVTTFLMLIPNYIMHKYITFNKKIFI